MSRSMMFGWLMFFATLLGGFFYYRNHEMWSTADSAEAADGVQSAAQAQDTGPAAGAVEGPLAEWVQQNQTHGNDVKPVKPRKMVPSDRVAQSPVGTSNAIVRNTFPLASMAKFTFEVPPHAANPQLHGTYHSFAAKDPSNDEIGDVDLLLMNDQQYDDFIHGRPADAVYSVDSSHDQDVHLGLPATMNRAAQYYLVFRNNSGTAQKKMVKANFTVDF
jgi:hypothetical protein